MFNKNQINYFTIPSYGNIFNSSADELAYFFFVNSENLSEKVSSEFGLNKNLYQNDINIQEKLHKLCENLILIFITEDNPIKLLNDSININNYTYTTLLGEKFDWVITPGKNFLKNNESNKRTLLPNEIHEARNNKRIRK